LSAAVKLFRNVFEPAQTLGEMVVYGPDQAVLFRCKTMELPWRNNETGISCIPAGAYFVTRRKSPKYGEHFHVLSVPGRSLILIHFGNYNHETRGCILPGAAFADLDGDGLRDVTRSRATMAKLLELLPPRFVMEVINNTATA
jgi:hypothetical protein